MGDWKDKLKDAWNQYGADVIAGGAGAVGGWFLPHLLWDKPSYVNKGASAALLAAISIAGQRGIKDAFKKQPKASTKEKATAFLGGLLGEDRPDDTAPRGSQQSHDWGDFVTRSYTSPLNYAASAPIGLASGAGLDVLWRYIQNRQFMRHPRKRDFFHVAPSSKNWKSALKSGGVGAFVVPIALNPIIQSIRDRFSSDK